MIEKSRNILVCNWLLLITFLVATMIVVGGLTRLTDSGLSITRWDLFSGILPPLNNNEWENLFILYQQIPEFKILKSSMTLDQFKVIFWWEFSHRMLGRVLGILYFFPLIYFNWRKLIPKRNLTSFYLIFFLILTQGLVGWYMVRSGLTESTDVSHYRLSLHLTIAFIILILLFWNYLSLNLQNLSIRNKKIPYILPVIFLFLVLLQISVGGLVSGLDAGQIYQTWPLMNHSYFPDDSLLSDLIKLESFNEPSIVQFIHRNLAYFIILIFFIILSFILRDKNLIYLKKSIFLIFMALSIQVFLGILTILSGAHIVIASMHQIGSIFLVIVSVILVYKN